MKKKKVVLIIMDGWGHGRYPAADAIYRANVPFVRSLYSKYQHTELITCGEDVGLPEGQMGNSEVGHMNIGAGRVVYQELVKINKSIRENELVTNKTLVDTFNYCVQNNKPLHLMGLVSDGGVHSHEKHLHALIEYASKAGVKKIYVHAFTDGRDTDPNGGKNYLENLLAFCNQYNAEVVSVVGRYYAMDRDKRWERVKKAYDLLIKGIGKESKNIIQSIEESYTDNVTDEFIMPIVKVDTSGKIVGRIKDGDAVLSFNYRTDRCREITEVLTQKDYIDYEMSKLNLYYVTMTIYNEKYIGVKNIFDNENLNFTLGEILEKNNKTQIRIAETEKYPHVTFFFSGGRENEFKGESRIMIQSPKVATYDLQPEMSALLVKEAIVKELNIGEVDFVCLNFANADMVGHTGVMSAVMKAVETVDSCVKEVVTTALKNGYDILLTADHGNADYMINEDGSANTAHTLNPVPLFLITNNNHLKIKKGRLADIAPTILALMDIEQPKEMTGINLLNN
jgi:2,3-bisphosphoglycerate-independent phosphoglycerate mutase